MEPPSGKTTVLFRSLPPRVRLSVFERKLIGQFAEELFQKLTAPATFTSLLTNDSELRTLNRNFLGNDYATDVLSFPSLPGSIDGGEIAISIERAAAQADAFGHSRIDEIRILMLHGVLHLTGLDHESDRGEMAAVEAEWRRHLHLPASLIERTKAAALKLENSTAHAEVWQ